MAGHLNELRRCTLALLVGALLPADSIAAERPADQPLRPCADALVQVIAASVTDFQDACSGAGASIAFFAAYRIEASAPLVIEVTPGMPSEAGPTAAGSFLEQRNRIFILPYADFRKNKTWFNVPIDRAVYRSLAAHEAAHAIAACNFKILNPTIQAKEYIAYAAMFSTMSEELRERALKSIPGEGFANEERITSLLYMFDPMRFGAESYRHFRKHGNRSKFLQAVLTGKALTD